MGLTPEHALTLVADPSVRTRIRWRFRATCICGWESGPLLVTESWAIRAYRRHRDGLPELLPFARRA